VEVPFRNGFFDVGLEFIDGLELSKDFWGSEAKVPGMDPNSLRHAPTPPTSSIGILLSIFSIDCSPIKRARTDSGESLEPRVVDASS
jgi:hypothetical protein